MRNYKKILFWLLPLIGILLVIGTMLFNCSKYKLMPTPSVNIENQEISVFDNESFNKLCLTLLGSTYGFSIDIESNQDCSVCSFHKSFDTNFFNRLFGIRTIIFKGKITIYLASSQNVRIDYLSHWIEIYGNNKSKYVKGSKYKNLLDEYLLIDEIKKWKDD